MIALKTILFSVFIPGTVVGVIPYLIITHTPRILIFNQRILTYAGLVLILAGLMIFFICARSFVIRGKGTPAPVDPPKFLVTSGPFKVVRNPMYCSGVLILTGEFLISGSASILLYLFFIWLMFHLFIVLYEEPHLRKVFGEPYEEYCREVPRWMPRPGRMPKQRGPDSR